MDFDLLLDAKGLMCPEPVMMLHKKVKDLDSGQVLKLEATDPSTKRDVLKFCSFLGFELVLTDEAEGVFLFWLKKP